MSAFPYLYTCEELGACQDRFHRCAGCAPGLKAPEQEPGQQQGPRVVRVVRMASSRRVHTMHTPEQPRATDQPQDKPPTRADARACAIFWRAVAVVYLCLLALLVWPRWA